MVSEGGSLHYNYKPIVLPTHPPLKRSDKIMVRLLSQSYLALSFMRVEEGRTNDLSHCVHTRGVMSSVTGACVAETNMSCIYVGKLIKSTAKGSHNSHERHCWKLLYLSWGTRRPLHLL
jgi:hypothetical protein